MASGTETDRQTGAETETGAEVQTGIETGAETGAASGSGDGVEPKAKRQRVPKKLSTTRLVVMEVDGGNLSQRRPRKRASATAIKLAAAYGQPPPSTMRNYRR